MILKSQQRFKIEAHCVYTEKVNKVALSSNDDKKEVQDQEKQMYY